MNILVVCLGGINRSIFCGTYLKHLRPDLEIRVRCTKDEQNRKATKKAKNALDRYNVPKDSLDAYRTKQVDKEDLEWSDLTIYMDNANYKNLLKVAGENEELKEKLKGLGTYGGYTRVPDPGFTSDEDKLYEMFKINEECTRKLAAELPRDEKE